MRTRIRLDSKLLAELEQLAAERGVALTSLIEDAIREWLVMHRLKRRVPTELPVFHGTGLLPGVDLNDSAALLDQMPGADGAR